MFSGFIASRFLRIAYQSNSIPFYISAFSFTRRQRGKFCSPSDTAAYRWTRLADVIHVL